METQGLHSLELQDAAFGDMEFQDILVPEFILPSSVVSASDNGGCPDPNILGGIISSKVLAKFMPILSTMNDKLGDLQVNVNRKRKLVTPKARGPTPCLNKFRQKTNCTFPRANGY